MICFYCLVVTMIDAIIRGSFKCLVIHHLSKLSDVVVKGQR